MNKFIVAAFICLASVFASAQKIVYAEPTRSQLHDLNQLKTDRYEIIGKFKSNVLIYKRIRNKDVICVYDENMEQVNQIDLDFLPNNILNYNFITYPDFFWMIFSYNKNNRVFCVTVKLGADGKAIGQPIQLDVIEAINTTEIKWYGIIKSEDKQKIMLLKGSSIKEDKYLIKTLLFDANLKLLNTFESTLPMDEQSDLLNEFALDNAGNLLFGKSIRSKELENTYGDYYLVKKQANDNFFLIDTIIDTIKLENVSLDDVKIRIDNFNKKYVLTSFCYKGNKKMIDGVFHSVVDQDINKGTENTVIDISDIYTGKNKYDEIIKSKINNYYLQNIILKKDGGFLICAENSYHGAYSNNVRSPDNKPSYYGAFGSSGAESSIRSGLIKVNLPFRSNANNIIVLSFDKNYKLEWNNTVQKTQFADQVDGGDAIISYQLVNTGSSICFLYNDLSAHPSLLTYQILASDGTIKVAPTLSGLNNKYIVQPRFAKQINQHETIIPCFYRNFLTFAKLRL